MVLESVFFLFKMGFDTCLMVGMEYGCFCFFFLSLVYGKGCISCLAFPDHVYSMCIITFMKYGLWFFVVLKYGFLYVLWVCV